MDKRVILTVAVSFGILFLWQKFLVPPPRPHAAQTATTQSSPNSASATNPTPNVAAANGATDATKPAAAANPNAAKAPRTIDQIEMPGLYRAKFSSWGAGLTEFTLLDPKYQENVGPNKIAQPINLVRVVEPELPLSIAFPNSDFSLLRDAAWQKVRQSDSELVYAWDSPSVHIEKQFHFVPQTYEIGLTITVENRGEKPLNEKLELTMYGWHDPNIKPGGMFGPRLIPTEGVCHLEGKVKRADQVSLLKQPINGQGLVRWVGIDEKYFLLAAAIQPSTDGRTCRLSAEPSGTIIAQFTTESRTVAPKASTSYVVTAFLGPKILKKLDEVKVGGVDAKLGDSINYGLTEFIARPMLAVLQAIHFVVPNWGVAIVILTILLKAATWYPSAKGMKSMKGMAKLKPEMDKLKEKFGDDKQKMNEAVMKLYQQHGINPLGGCLPMLLQFPIWIALYSMLGNSVELYRSGFTGWIHDLTAPDPYFVLPVLTGILTFVQQKLSPTSTDPNQKTMMYIMPVMFLGFTIFLPAGLSLYMLVNAILSMIQQALLNRQDPPVLTPARG